MKSLINGFSLLGFVISWSKKVYEGVILFVWNIV